jgi:hypothetical protein
MSYYCPMHSEVRKTDLGKCPKCGMVLVAEGSHSPFIQHVMSRPLHAAVMLVLMIAVMAAAMMAMRGAF